MMDTKKLQKIPKAKIYFRVKFKGENEPRKVNYEVLRDNAVLHNYLKSIKATTLIPTKYKLSRANQQTST